MHKAISCRNVSNNMSDAIDNYLSLYNIKKMNIILNQTCQTGGLS